jgi:hypothetical protein
MRSKRTQVLGLALVCLAGCGSGNPNDAGTATTSEPITSGSLDETDNDVVSLELSGGGIECTGTLVAPQLVVTAGHCIAGDEPSAVGVGPDAENPERSIPVALRQVHSGFDPVSLDNDLAVLWLSAPADGVTVALLPTSPALPVSGDSVQVAGFGRTGALGATPPNHLRLAGAARVSGSDATHLWLAPGPSQPCAGDSGGPIFGDGPGRPLLAVTSQGDPGCDHDAAATPLYSSIAVLIDPWLHHGDGGSSSGCAVALRRPERPSSRWAWGCFAAIALAFARRRGPRGIRAARRQGHAKTGPPASPASPWP